MVRPARVSDNDIIKLTLHDHVWHYEQHAHCLPSTYYTSDERSKMSVKNNFSIYYGTLMQSHRPNGKGRPWQRAAPRRIRHLPPTMRRRRGRGEPQCASALQQLLSALHTVNRLTVHLARQAVTIIVQDFHIKLNSHILWPLMHYIIKVTISVCPMDHIRYIRIFLPMQLRLQQRIISISDVMTKGQYTWSTSTSMFVVCNGLKHAIFKITNNKNVKNNNNNNKK